MAASGVAKCTSGFGEVVVGPGSADDGGDDGGDDGADDGADDRVRAGGVVADAIGPGATTVVGADVTGLDRPPPHPAAARARATPAATPSNERWAEANEVGVIGRPLSAGSDAAWKGRLS
jgi:hypothetical protein